jgi:hypothetical protein
MMEEFKRRKEDKTGYHEAFSDMEASFRYCPKFDLHELSEEQIEDIASKAAKKAVELAKTDMYQGVGKAVVGWVFYVIGAAAIGLFVLGVKLGWWFKS